ncbi:MAG: hypothetical protein ACI4DY_12030 [Monoglobaceae bacterium]
MQIYTVAFFGHRYIVDPFQIESRIDIIIEKLIKEKQYVEFLVGRNGDFDQFVSSAVIRAKRKYRDDNSSLVLVLPYLTAEYRNNVEYFEEYYDEIEICQESAKAHFKSALQIRNREMVDRADLIVCCIDHKSGGAYQTIQYAKKQNKKIINLALEETDDVFI